MKIEKIKILVADNNSEIIKNILDLLKAKGFKYIITEKDGEKLLSKAEKSIIIENNATSQFGKLIKLSTGYEIKDKILQYTGLPFSVESIEKQVKKLAKVN